MKAQLVEACTNAETPRLEMQSRLETQRLEAEMSAAAQKLRAENEAESRLIQTEAMSWFCINVRKQPKPALHIQRCCGYGSWIRSGVGAAGECSIYIGVDKHM